MIDYIKLRIVEYRWDGDEDKMASRIIHLVISQIICEYFDLDTGRFNLGNLLPDLHANTKEAKATSHFRILREPYEDSNTNKYQYFDYNHFLDKYKDKINDDVYLGYYCHLITDELWIQNIYIKYMRDENRKKWVNEQENYYHDFSKLNEIIIRKYNLKINIDFEIIEMKEINPEKIIILKADLENDFKIRYDDLKLRLFKYEDIINFIEETSSIIIIDLKSKKLR